MSMASVNRHFQHVIGNAAASRGCTMEYERGEDGKQRQRLTCTVVLPNGDEQTVSGLYDGDADLVLAADHLANEFLGGL